MGLGSLVGISSFILRGKFIYHLWESVHQCWNLFAGVFVGICLCLLCYEVYKNGKYFIYPEGKIFGVYIRYVKIRSAIAHN